MNSNRMVWMGAFIGSIVGGYVPILWGASTFSMSGLIFSSVGAVAGIYLMYRISE
jgi:uncharacterized membrane protein YeaQ/YmgE (transglycosylase-associated protein family)